MRTIQSILDGLPQVGVGPLQAPRYDDPGVDLDSSCMPVNVGMAVASMHSHTTDEGWQLFQGLEAAGYNLVGHGVEYRGAWYEASNQTDCFKILSQFNPHTVFIQDKREWTGKTADGPRTFDRREMYTNVGALRERPDVFKVSVVKDAHRDRELNVELALEAGVHAWVVYYHPAVVARQSPFLRPQHLIRTYHSIDRDAVPVFAEGRKRKDCLLSGALSDRVYPLRTRLAREKGRHARNGMRWLDYLPHPGYRRDRCYTPEYLGTLNAYKVAICTSSVWGYALRKIVEATACGCRVITDLPTDEVMPAIDGNLIRVDPDVPLADLKDLVRFLADGYDDERQQCLASMAIRRYDYREVGYRLADDVEKLRGTYHGD